MKKISFLTAFFLLVPLFAEESLWVDNLKGSDANPGTEAAPLATIEKACSIVKKSQKITVVNTGKPYSLPYGGFNKAGVATDTRRNRRQTADRRGQRCGYFRLRPDPGIVLDPGTGKNEHFLASFLANGQQLQEYLFRPEFLAGRHSGLVRGQCCRSKLSQSCRTGKNSRGILVEQERKTCSVRPACRKKPE